MQVYIFSLTNYYRDILQFIEDCGVLNLDSSSLMALGILENSIPELCCLGISPLLCLTETNSVYRWSKSPSILCLDTAPYPPFCVYGLLIFKYRINLIINVLVNCVLICMFTLHCEPGYNLATVLELTTTTVHLDSFIKVNESRA